MIAAFKKQQSLADKYGDEDTGFFKGAFPGGKDWTMMERFESHMADIFGLGDNWQKQMSANTEAIEEFKAEFPEEWAFMEENEIKSLDDWKAKVMGLSDSIEFLSNQEKNSMGIIVGGYQDAAEAVYEFGNAREELFYGMSQQNLTGDLIRQVQQTGVENLIAHTEVVMTNNFNGMTTEQVAAQIIAEIERGMGLQNWNVETA